MEKSVNTEANFSQILICVTFYIQIMSVFLFNICFGAFNGI